MNEFFFLVMKNKTVYFTITIKQEVIIFVNKIFSFFFCFQVFKHIMKDNNEKKEKSAIFFILFLIVRLLRVLYFFFFRKNQVFYFFYFLFSFVLFMRLNFTHIFYQLCFGLFLVLTRVDATALTYKVEANEVACFFIGNDKPGKKVGFYFAVTIF